MQLENSNNNAGDWQYIKKKKDTSNIYVDLINNEKISQENWYNALLTKNDEFIDRTETEEIDNKKQHGKINSQKSQPEVK